MKYEDFNLVPSGGIRGYRQIDAVDIYADSGLTVKFEIPTKIASDTSGKLFGWISDGMAGSYRPNSQYTNEVAKQSKIVDGIIDGNSNTWERIDLDGTPASTRVSMPIGYFGLVDENNITFYFNDAVYELQYAEYDISEVLLNSSGWITTNNTNVSLNVITKKIRLSFRRKDLATFPEGEIRDVDIRVYDGNPIPTPTTGVFESGNSIVKNDMYNGERVYDTSGLLYDVSSGYQLVIPYDNLQNITNQQLFMSEDKQKIGFFSTSLTEPCYTKANLFFDLIESLYDSLGNKLYDSDESELYTLKDNVTIG